MQVEPTPKVSVCVTTFNHEKYVRECLDSILSQKTSFEFEVIVHDDASQDRTPEIILEYAKNYPSIIVPMLQTVNCYSTDRHAPLLNCARAAKADYVAICEGDDYWINDNKLEIQKKLLDKNKNACLIIGPGRLEFNGNILEKTHCYYGDVPRIFRAQDVLNVVNEFSPTASYFCPKEILINALSLFHNAPVGDLFIEVYAGIKGEIVYLPEVFSVYRMQTESSWSANMAKSPVEKKQAHISQMECAIELCPLTAENIKLDWGTKKAAMYHSLAFVCLDNNLRDDFIFNIERSVKFKIISKKQILLYRLRHLGHALTLLRKAQIFTRRLMAQMKA